MLIRAPAHVHSTHAALCCWSKLAAHSQPALRTGLMAPALASCSICIRGVILDLLNFHIANIVPTLAALFLAIFEALREEKGPFNACLGSTKDQTAPEDARLLCRATLWPTTEISHVIANGNHRLRPIPESPSGDMDLHVLRGRFGRMRNCPHGRSGK